MTEFILSSEQLERLIEGIEHNTGRRINQVICDGAELPVVVRCRDCKLSVAKGHRLYCDLNAGGFPNVEPDGFCAWGERREK